MSAQYELASAPTDAISATVFAPSASKLLVSSWDKFIYLYDIDSPSNSQLVKRYEHRAPVLDVCFGEDDGIAFSAGLDWDVRRIDLGTGNQTVLSSHTAGVRAVRYSERHRVLVSASWDSTLHIHHTSDALSLPATVPLPAKPFALALSESKLIVAMSGRLVHIYDLASLSLIASQAGQPLPNTIEPAPLQVRESSLKFMTRALACMPNGQGYATSSIEGRVAVEWFDASDESQARKYAFKCHREAGDDGTDVVYPVHALSFHPIHGTFVSGGGDGVVAMWDAVAKRRIRQYPRFPESVAAMDFSQDGTKLAVAVSSGFEEGKPDANNKVVKIFIREIGDSEAKSKATRG